MIVNIQVARTCNLRCTFCSHDVWAEPTGLMDYGLFEHVISSLKADDCKTVCFVAAQGEPLLHPRIMQMLAVAQDSGFETNLCTNGTPLNERRISELARLNLASIQFSFAGWDKASYERAYVGGKFERVSVNLKALISVLRGKRTVLSINGVLSDPDDFERTRDYLHSLGARDNEIRLQLAHNWGGTVKTPFRPTGSPPLCPLLVSTPGIYHDGRVTACGCIDANGALEIGHIREHGLNEIRRGERYQSMLQAFADGNISGLPLCAKCEVPWLSSPS
jgi:MoaA/NifB/PqqE/SkfB family radical SAM enzyme